MGSFEVDSDAAAVARQLLAAADQLRDLEPVNRRAGELVAAAPAPRQSGRLAASVRADASAAGVVIGSPLRYATFVHWGAPARHIKARPWLLDQLEDHEPDLIDLYRTHVSDALALVRE